MATAGFLFGKIMNKYDSGWHEWFAWYPIKYKGKYVWLTKLWRRYEFHEVFGLGTCSYYEFTTLEDYLASK